MSSERFLRDFCQVYTSSDELWDLSHFSFTNVIHQRSNRSNRSKYKPTKSQQCSFLLANKFARSLVLKRFVHRVLPSIVLHSSIPRRSTGCVSCKLEKKRASFYLILNVEMLAAWISKNRSSWRDFSSERNETDLCRKLENQRPVKRFTR